jgi:thiol-disulfide isomerase/thioredoxin
MIARISETARVAVTGDSLMKMRSIVPVLAALCWVAVTRADDAPTPAATTSKSATPPKSVTALLAAHERQLMQSLLEYISVNPKAADLDQAYMLLFERVIENDWFAETEEVAKRYLTERKDGAVRPLAQIVVTMARAQAGKFDQAWVAYRDLIRSLDNDEQEEFAAQFADTLANAASAAGEYDVARKVYDALLQRFGTNPSLSKKIKDDLARLDKIGKPAPAEPVRDLQGRVLRTSDFKGKYVLVDFWATWCNPCIADLPNVQAAYAKYHTKGLEIVAVSLDESVDAVKDFVAARKIPWRQVHNTTSGGDLVGAYGVTSIPATFLIAPDGTIVRMELRGPALEKALGTLIK